MYSFDLIVFLFVDLNNLTFDQFWNVMLLFTSVMLSTRSFCTSTLVNMYELCISQFQAWPSPPGNVFNGRIPHPPGKKSSKPPAPGPIKTS